MNVRISNPHPCFCKHAKRNHIGGEALCLVRSCRLCLVYRPAPPLYWADTNGNDRITYRGRSHITQTKES